MSAQIVRIDNHITPFESANMLTVAVRENMEWDSTKALRLMNNLSRGRFICRIYADSRNVRWQIIDVDDYSRIDQIASAVNSIYTDAVIDVSPYEEPTYTQQFARFVIPYIQHAHFARPIRYVEGWARNDPFIPFVHMAGQLEEGERVIYSIYFRANNQKLIQMGLDYLTAPVLQQLAALTLNFVGGVAGALTQGDLGWSVPIPGAQFNAQVENLLTEKIQNGVFPTYILLQIDTRTVGRAESLSVSLESALSEFNTFYQSLRPYYDAPFVNEYLNLGVTSVEQAIRSSAYARFRELHLRAENKRFDTDLTRVRSEIRNGFNLHELASLWHLPHSLHTAQRLHTISMKHVLAPEALRNNTQGVRLGVNVYGNTETPIYLPDESRFAHIVVVGETEVGKSNLLHQMIQQDIAKGRGVAVLDPENRLIPDILKMSIPERRKGDVVIWDLDDWRYPPPLNPLAAADDAEREAYAYRLANIFSRIEAGFDEKRMAETLSNTLEALTAIPNATLRDIQKMLEDYDFREQYIDYIEDDAAYDFWLDYHENENKQGNLKDPILRRLRDFYRKTLYYITCHPQPFSIDRFLSEKKILLFSIKSDRLPMRSLNILGSMLISQFQFAASADAAKEPFFLYVDEADRFVSDSVPDLYQRARKRNVHVTLAVQYLEKLESGTQSAVLQSTGTFFAFKSGGDTARKIALRTQPQFGVDDLVRLDPHHMAVFTKFDKKTLPAFSVRTELVHPLQGEKLASPGEVRRLSRSRYTPISADEIRQSLRERYPRRRRATGSYQEEAQDYDYMSEDDFDD